MRANYKKTFGIMGVTAALVLAMLVVATGQIPTILPVSPVTEAMIFEKTITVVGSITTPTIYGSAASGGNLALNSTSHATKGTITANDPFALSSTARNLKTWWDYEEFVGGGSTGPYGLWLKAVSGTGASSFDTGATALRPGILELNTGTTTTGRVAIHVGIQVAVFVFGAGTYTSEADIYITTLSDATETYALRFGFGDSVTNAPTDGAYFRYSDAGGGSPTPNWYRCTASNTTITATDTTVAAAAGAWTRLKVVVNANGTSVEYFINGVSVGTNTTNIPTGVARHTTAIVSLIKSAGTTARTANIDWAWLHVDLTTSR